MKQRTILASVVLPISALTGFFGQYFGWLVGRIQSLGSFLLLGVGGDPRLIPRPVHLVQAQRLPEITGRSARAPHSRRQKHRSVEDRRKAQAVAA